MRRQRTSLFAALGSASIVRGGTAPSFSGESGSVSSSSIACSTSVFLSSATAQSFSAAGTVPPFFSSSRITALWSQMFISAEPSFAPE